MIKFYDLNKQDSIIEKKIVKSISKVIKKKNFINGKEVFLFEKNFSKFSNAKYSIGCSNGTDALISALKSLNLKKGDEVILPGMTYISTCFAVLNAGLVPVLVDIDFNTGLIDIDLIKKKISKKTKVILPVHLYGNIVNIKKIRKAIDKKIFIIDDASQAHGGYYKNKNYKVGSMCHMSCFSLYPGKNLGAYGDAGIITTDKKKLKNKLQMITNLGLLRDKKYDHEIIGSNNRLDTLQAAILLEKLKYLSSNNKRRALIANFYNQKIDNPEVRKIKYINGSVYHQYIILVKNRNAFQDFMLRHNIQTGIHYPKSISMHKALKHFFNQNETPLSRKFSQQCVSIPIDPFLKKKEMKRIAEVINMYKN